MPSVRDAEVGAELPPLARVVTAQDVKAYADAAGDRNPLHQDDAVARAAGFPGIIAHGMFTMAHLVTCLTDWVGDPGALKSIAVQFRAVVYMDEEIVAHGEVTSVDPDSRRATLSVWVELDRAGQRMLPIKNSVAELQLA
jgi:acyl dehydratase